MTQEEYRSHFAQWAQMAENRLQQLCDLYLPGQAEIGQAARYSCWEAASASGLYWHWQPANWRGSLQIWLWTTPVPWRCCTAIP